MAPSARVNFLFGITSSGSTSILVPSPEHSSQAPYGLLNEKVRGLSSLILNPHLGQANFSENTYSLSLCKTATSPLPAFKAVSTESKRRTLSTLPPVSIRSTTTSMLCFFLGSISIPRDSETVTICPSILARTKPALDTSSNIALCSPFFPETNGASITTSPFSFLTAEEISVWLDASINILQFGQCGF